MPKTMSHAGCCDLPASIAISRISVLSSRRAAAMSPAERCQTNTGLSPQLMVTLCPIPMGDRSTLVVLPEMTSAAGSKLEISGQAAAARPNPAIEVAASSKKFRRGDRENRDVLVAASSAD